jgi:hypothetical protein
MAHPHHARLGHQEGSHGGGGPVAAGGPSQGHSASSAGERSIRHRGVEPGRTAPRGHGVHGGRRATRRDGVRDRPTTAQAHRPARVSRSAGLSGCYPDRELSVSPVKRDSEGDPLNFTRALAAPRRRHASSIGGGYAGLMAAHRLTQPDDDVAVTMVNPRPPFVHRTRLQQVLGGIRRRSRREA